MSEKSAAPVAQSADKRKHSQAEHSHNKFWFFKPWLFFVNRQERQHRKLYQEKSSKIKIKSNSAGFTTVFWCNILEVKLEYSSYIVSHLIN